MPLGAGAEERRGWPATEREALAEQARLRPLAVLDAEGPARPRTLAGLDVAYAGTGGPEDRVAGAVVVLDAATLDVIEEATAIGPARFPYIPGLFAFREVPVLLAALAKLTAPPDLLLCDGHGLAHPRRFGLACHLGVLTGLPTAGVAKTRLIGTHAEPGPERGDHADLVDEADGAVLGRVLRTQRGVKPVYLSVGHRVGLDDLTRHVLAAAPRYRLPETTRRADRLCRDALDADTRNADTRNADTEARA
ncbi:endonuclease V [Mangrovactinospora gilvigrisea]|uniref:Endonuclease V n=1 Tax=Mangrovactinospora gilvigrisea TaxID=1428644 RepID=A0A1J7BJT1_9ACTN|nr:endonuclease V [Mangrovactinospora gilvigrisea]OIV38894.1 endonuclease V [Mangrovactinospora gilvigrisea]